MSIVHFIPTKVEIKDCSWFPELKQLKEFIQLK